MSSAAPVLATRELVLDRYRPLRPLGSGSSGSVWLARDESNGLDVALKIVPREGKAGYRAEREAEAAARLRHERCLRAYGFGSDAGHVYIAYEYVGGRTLRDAMRAGELRDAEAVEAASQILEGLAHAHQRGIVHRDVKPTNVLLADGDGISVRLLDFGLAQFDEADTLTAVGDVPGTLAYISPERLRGAEADARERRVGRRDPALGGARGPPSVLGRPAPADGRRDRGRRAGASSPSGPTCRSGSSRPSTARSTPTPPGGLPLPLSPRSSATPGTSGGAGREAGPAAAPAAERSASRARPCHAPGAPQLSSRPRSRRSRCSRAG